MMTRRSTLYHNSSNNNMMSGANPNPKEEEFESENDLYKLIKDLKSETQRQVLRDIISSNEELNLLQNHAKSSREEEGPGNDKPLSDDPEKGLLLLEGQEDSPWASAIQLKILDIKNRNLRFLPLSWINALLRANLKFAHLEHGINTQQILVRINKRVPISPAGIAGILTVFTGFILQRIGRKNPLFLSHLLGFLFPAYRSILAVERPRLNDDERWLTYWSCFGLFNLLDHHFETIQKKLQYYYIPKLIILYWISQDGSLVIYRRLLRPLLLKLGYLATSSADEE